MYTPEKFSISGFDKQQYNYLKSISLVYPLSMYVSSYSGVEYGVRRIIKSRGIQFKNTRLTQGDMLCVDGDLYKKFIRNFR